MVGGVLFSKRKNNTHYGSKHIHSTRLALCLSLIHIFGVKVIGVEPADFNDVIKVSGRVLPSSSGDIDVYKRQR